MVVLRCKVVLFGDGTVGKSALSQMVHSGGVTFPKNYSMTMGCEYCIKEVKIDQQTTVEIHIWDVAGQEAYKKQASLYLDNAAHFIVMYDISNKTTFEHCHSWSEVARGANKALPGTLIANKIDLKDKAEVSDQQGEIFAQKHKMGFAQCSALRGVGLMEPIEAIARQFAMAYEDRARACAGFK